MRYVIVGSGVAGLSAAVAITSVDRFGSIVILSDESDVPYARTMLPHYLSGMVTREEISCSLTEKLDEMGINLRKKAKVKKIVPECKTLALFNDKEIKYDRLLITTGSKPIIPQIRGINNKSGIYKLWTLNDANKIIGSISQGESAVVIGAGFIGLQVAIALNEAGMNVTLLEKCNNVLPAHLDKVASNYVFNKLQKIGISVRTGVTVEKFKGGKTVQGVVTSSGDFPCTLVVVAVGVIPNKQLVQDTEIAFDRGILVDRHMKTNVDDVYAAGDVAESLNADLEERNLIPTWSSAVAQGRCAGRNMANQLEKYQGDIRVNSINISDLKIVSMGVVHPKNGRFKDVTSESESGYRKILVQNGVIKGAIIMGHIDDAGIFANAIRKKAEHFYNEDFSLNRKMSVGRAIAEKSIPKANLFLMK